MIMRDDKIKNAFMKLTPPDGLSERVKGLIDSAAFTEPQTYCEKPVRRMGMKRGMRMALAAAATLIGSLGLYLHGGLIHHVFQYLIHFLIFIIQRSYSFAAKVSDVRQVIIPQKTAVHKRETVICVKIHEFSFAVTAHDSTRRGTFYPYSF